MRRTERVTDNAEDRAPMRTERVTGNAEDRASMRTERVTGNAEDRARNGQCCTVTTRAAWRWGVGGGACFYTRAGRDLRHSCLLFHSDWRGGGWWVVGGVQ